MDAETYALKDGSNAKGNDGGDLHLDLCDRLAGNCRSLGAVSSGTVLGLDVLKKISTMLRDG